MLCFDAWIHKGVFPVGRNECPFLQEVGKSKLSLYLFPAALPCICSRKSEQLEGEVPYLQRDNSLVFDGGQQFRNNLSVLAADEIDVNFEVDAWEMFIPLLLLFNRPPSTGDCGEGRYDLTNHFEKVRPIHAGSLTAAVSSWGELREPRPAVLRG